MKAGTGGDLTGDHERKAVVVGAPYFHALGGTVELHGHRKSSTCSWPLGNEMPRVLISPPAHSPSMGTKSREKLHGSSIRASASRAAEARKVADRLALAKPGINA